MMETNENIFWEPLISRRITNQLLENLVNEKYSHILKTAYGGTDLTYMQLISKYNKAFRFLVCVFNILSKYTWSQFAYALFWKRKTVLNC